MLKQTLQPDIKELTMLANKTENPAYVGQKAASGFRLAFMLVTTLFFLWGLSYGLLDVLNKHFQEVL
ncbi:L-fucose transporter, partial [Ewingella americana ATCC 33852]